MDHLTCYRQPQGNQCVPGAYRISGHVDKRRLHCFHLKSVGKTYKQCPSTTLAALQPTESIFAEIVCCMSGRSCSCLLTSFGRCRCCSGLVPSLPDDGQCHQSCSGGRNRCNAAALVVCRGLCADLHPRRVCCTPGPHQQLQVTICSCFLRTHDTSWIKAI